jgi:lysophospholipid hydrolase
MPKTFFNALALRHPEITIQISRIVAARSKDAIEYSQAHRVKDFGKNNINLRTVAIVPVNAQVPVLDFAEKLHEALLSIGQTAKLLDYSTIVQVLGRHTFSQIGKLKLTHWLAEQEEYWRVVLYVADSGASSPWTQRCIRQADCIFLVGLGSGDASISEVERMMLAMKTTARKELILLHPERQVPPNTTQGWLKDREWIHAHHHVQLASLTQPRLLRKSGRKNTLLHITNQLASIVQDFQTNRSMEARIMSSPAAIKMKTSAQTYSGHRSDFARLARRICGRSVALVLGGGGARGIAHLGVIRALEEVGIPVDMVGGTSIGAYMGGLYARDSDYVAMYPYAKWFSSRMSSKWRMALDLTYPVTSWFTGHEFNRGIWKCFSDVRIEDFWLNYYCNTVNITWGRMDFHQFGYAWRYIRASMSLSGFVPPLCDNGDMLVDGGYVDNLTVAHMKSLGADTVIAVDVGSIDDTSPIHFGDSVNGFFLLLQRLNPFRRAKTVPSLAEIQSRLAYVSTVKTLEVAKALPGCLYLQPPIQGYATLEFNKFDEIFQTGYKYGKEVMRQWKQDGTLQKLLGDKSHVKAEQVRTRRNSF